MRALDWTLESLSGKCSFALDGLFLSLACIFTKRELLYVHVYMATPSLLVHTSCCFISSVAGTDYVAQSINLTFSHGDMEICHTVDILQDDECEPMPENFFSDLEYVSGIQTIDIMPDTTEVFIDDSNEPECGECRINCRSKVNHMYTYQVISLNVNVKDS